MSTKLRNVAVVGFAQMPTVTRDEHRMSTEMLYPVVREALAQVGLKGREDHTTQELSGGQQQRVAIARAIVTRPALLLADEPTGNLDTKTSIEIMELITALNRDRGITVVMVTHEEDIAAHAGRLLRFVDGHLASDSATDKKETADVL